MHLDVPTLFTTITLAYVVGAVVLGMLAFALQSFPKHIRLSWAIWSFAMLLSGSCAALVGMRGTISDILSIAVANALMLFGFGLRPNGLSLLNSKKIAYPWLPYIATFGWLGLYAVPWFRESLLLRVLYVNSFSILAMSICIRECWRHNKAQQISARLLIGVFCVDILVRLTLVSMHLQTHYPSFKAAFQAPPVTFALLALLVAILLKILGLGIVVFEQLGTQYRTQATLNPLTALPNRRAFVSAAQARLDKINRGGQSYALILMELDDLQSINSRFGHSMGDAFLRLLGRIAQEPAKDHAQVGHIRDNQFVLFLPKTTPAEAGAIAQRISRSLTSETAQASGERLAATVSAGLFYGGTDTSLERALEVADHCLSRAKFAGGNRIVANDKANIGPLKPETLIPPFATRPQVAAEPR